MTGATSTAGGTVTYYYFSGGNCPYGGVQVGSPVQVTNGIVPDSEPQKFNNAGSYSWAAYYNGDANNNPKMSSCESLIVKKANPFLSIFLDSNNITVGDSTYAGSLLANSSSNVSGTVQYEFFSSNYCTGTMTTVFPPVSVTNGRFTTSGVVLPISTSRLFSKAGSYSWNAVYPGDGNNNGATSECETLTVGATVVKVTTSLAVRGSITVGGRVAFSSSLLDATSNAGGTVTYQYFTGGSCSGSGTQVFPAVTVSDRTVPNSASVQFNSAGPESWNAAYSGDQNNTRATSECKTFTVNMASPTITLDLSSTQIALTPTAIVNVSATLINGFDPSGTVKYYYYSGDTCTSLSPHEISSVTAINNKVPSAGWTPDEPGSYSMNAVYYGDNNNAGATSSPVNPDATSNCEFLAVNKPGASITTALSTSKLAPGNTVFDSATLSGTTGSAGGTVTYEFFSGAYCSGSATAVGSVNVTNGVVPNSASQTFSSPGNYSWNAAYSGDSKNNGVTSPCEPLTVGHLAITTVTVSCNRNPVVVGSRTTCTAKVSNDLAAPPAGKVTWSSSGSGTFSPKDSSCALTSHKSYSGCSVGFTPTAAGSSVILTANYGGDSKNFPSKSGTQSLPGTQSLNVTETTSTTKVLCRPASAPVASSKKTTTIKCKATVRGYEVFGESVTWAESGNGFVSFSALTCTLVKSSGTSGSCSVFLTGAQAGTVTVTASYAGDPNNQASSSKGTSLTIT